MAIEFKCTSCQQTLRVPDESAGKQARCPKCQAIVAVPGSSGDPGSGMGTGSSTNIGSAGWTGSSGGQPTGGSELGWGDGGQPVSPSGFPQPAPPSGDNPFAYAPQPAGSPNPYAAPQPFAEKPASYVVSGNIVATSVEAGDVIGYAWEVWKNNLGLLVGVFATILGITYALSFAFGALQAIVEQAGGDEGAVLGGLLSFAGNIVVNCVSVFLGIGSTQISLRLARGHQAEFADVFRGGPLFLPVLGVSILFGMATGVGFLLLIIPGILVLLFYWPCYYLVLDQKTGVFESFSTAYEIAKGNPATTFVLWLAGVGITILGILAACVGLIFAVPLAQLLWVVAYLMMTGQLSTRPGYPSKTLA